MIPRRYWLVGLLFLLLACTVRGRPRVPAEASAPRQPATQGPVAETRPRAEPKPDDPAPGRPASPGSDLPGAASVSSGAAEPATPAAVTAPPAAAGERAPEASPVPPIPPRQVGNGKPVWVRVGLETDLKEVTLPCCDSAVTVDFGPADSGEGSGGAARERVAVVSPLTVKPAAGAVRRGAFRFQVAALKDEGQAWELARRLGGRLGQPADAHFDAGIDLYRVRVGRYATREAAEAQRRLLGPQIAADAWLVEEGGGLDAPALEVVQNGRPRRVTGRWLALDPGGEGGIRVQGNRYRGRILVYLNNRGSLNLINELPLEDYLRGVVPREMGPEVYDRLEALKAQAVAARTYTLHNLGEFVAEGYDICATPRCHVYGGMEAEHPVSDRAIAETADQVLVWDGKPIEAMYTSTCGGHTEDVAVVFPLKVDRPYLVGVPCYESGVHTLRGTLPTGTPFPQGLTHSLLPAPSGLSAPQAFAARLDRLASLAGLPPGGKRLAALDRRAVQRSVASTFDLVLDARLFVLDADLEYLLDSPPPDWDREDLRRAAYLAKSGLMSGSLDGVLSEREQETLLLRLAEMLQLIREEPVRFVDLDGRALSVRADKVDGGAERTIHLPEHLAAFRGQGEGWSAGSLAMVAGDRLRLWWQGERLVGLVQEVDTAGVAYDRGSKWSSWTRYRSDSRLAQLVEERYPGLGFERLDILGRGPSGRVAKIRLHGRGGQVQDVEGLAIRWVLDVPETFFTAHRATPRGREAGWSFRGKGWGHGVGMCQVGAFGMAGRRHSYRDILSHYYRGAQLVRVRGAA